MAPPTRSRPLRTTTPEPLNSKEADSPRKTTFYNTLACDRDKKALRTIAKEYNITSSIIRDWRNQYEAIGSLIKRYLQSRSKILGRKSKVTKPICKILISLLRNPVRKQPLDIQIKFYKLPVKVY
jgi:hypothetical protein